MKYAGIGARDTPTDILVVMNKIARIFAERDLVLCTGGAVGADAAFLSGAYTTTADEEGPALDPLIYLPWPGFNHRILQRHPIEMSMPQERAIAVASWFHPAWHRCNADARLLHGRNVHILLGTSMKSPVGFVLCWTKSGRIVGGTGLGIRVAKGYEIPVFNLGSLTGEQIVALYAELRDDRTTAIIEILEKHFNGA